jgi:iron complex outermembrane receptor protein
MARTLSARTFWKLGAALAALSAAPAFAQTQAADPEMAAPDLSEEESGEIVVTARKREERLLDVPIAVTAISAETIGKLQANDLGGIQGTVPNVNLVQGRGSSSNANIFIRGIGQPDALQTFDPAVGIYVDGVYMSRIQGALFNLFDVQRVEVLRGPQGTLYGKNTVGGAVNVVSRKPDTREFHAAGSATYGSFDQILVNGYASVPLIQDVLALSVAGVYDKRDGIVIDPLTGRDYNDRNTQAGRAILRATPGEGMEFILTGDYTRQRTAPSLGYATANLTGVLYSPAFAVIGIPTLKPAYPYGPYSHRASTSLAPGQGQRLDHWGVSFTANIDLSDSVSLTSITAYRDLRPDYYIDFDATELELADAFVGVRQHQFSQELQLKYDGDQLNGVFGLYYLDESITSHQESYDDYYLFLQATPTITVPLTFTRFIDDAQNVKSYAAFGQLTYDFTDQLSLTGGLRYSKEKKTYNRSTYTVLAGAAGAPFLFPGSLPAPYNGSNEVEFDAWTPSATLSYKPTPGTMVYASAARGFKSGGFNGRVNGIGDVTQVVNGVTTIVPYFEPETVWTYEVGAKGSFLNGAVTIAADVFQSDYTDFQARVGGGTTGIAGGSFPVVNAGKMRIRGVEVEMTVKPVRAWTIRTSFGYLDADYLEFNDGRRAPAFSCNPTGNAITCEPPFAPPISFALASDYAVPLGDAGTLTFGADSRFVDKHFLSVDNRSPGLVEDGYWLLNAYVQYDLPGGNAYLRGGVKNLTESIYKTDGQEFSSVGNIQTAYYGDPRTWSITAGFRF